MSYFKQIYEPRYNQELLDIANKLTQGQGDGRISYDDVVKICDFVTNGLGFKENGITNIEVETLKYIYKNYNLTSDTAKLKLMEFIIFVE